MDQPTVSIVIPTYNRKESLLRLLDSISRQAYPAGRLEVIVVDDGGSDGSADITPAHFSFGLTVVNQENAGATAARNHGARLSGAEILIFVDDDMALAPAAIAALVACLQSTSKNIVLGRLRTPEAIVMQSKLARIAVRAPLPVLADREVPCVECKTGFLGIRREEFLHLGMFEDPTGGWPNWDDVDFGYRAHQLGYRFVECAQAVAEHWDYALADLKTACLRWERASRSAAKLAERHPGILALLPMFRDKEPIAWRSDPLALILRKLARQMASSRSAMWVMECTVPRLERSASESSLLALLYRWIVSGYIYRGYREGLRAITVQSKKCH